VGSTNSQLENEIVGRLF